MRFLYISCFLGEITQTQALDTNVEVGKGVSILVSSNQNWINVEGE